MRLSSNFSSGCDKSADVGKWLSSLLLSHCWNPPMTTISPNAKIVTLINVFTVEPANQRQLVELLAGATEASVRFAPGFISASLHRGLDGTKVTMYAQWRSVEDYQAMRENPAPLPYFQQALTIAKFDPGMYEVVETYSGTATEP